MRASGRRSAGGNASFNTVTSAQLDSVLFDDDSTHGSPESLTENKKHVVGASNNQNEDRWQPAPPPRSFRSLTGMPVDVPPQPPKDDGLSTRTTYVPEEEFLRKRNQDRALSANAVQSEPGDTGYISSLVTGVRLNSIKSDLARASTSRMYRKVTALQDVESPNNERPTTNELVTDQARKYVPESRPNTNHKSYEPEHNQPSQQDQSDPHEHTHKQHRAKPQFAVQVPHTNHAESQKSSTTSSYAIANGRPGRNDYAYSNADSNVASTTSPFESMNRTTVSNPTIFNRDTGADCPTYASKIVASPTETTATLSPVPEQSSGIFPPSTIAAVPPSHRPAKEDFRPRRESATYSDLENASICYDNIHQNRINEPPTSAQLNGSKEPIKSVHMYRLNQLRELPNGRDSPTSDADLSRANSYQHASYRAPSTQPSYRGPSGTLKRRQLNGDAGRFPYKTYVPKVHKAVTDGQLVVPDPYMLRSPVTTVYSRHEDFYAEPGKSYYVPDGRKKRRMCCVVPCYNEPSDALRRTLTTLHCQLDNLRRLDFDFHAVIIMDGWQLTSESMRTYLQTIFDMPENVENEGPTWWDDLNTLEGNPSVETFIIQNVNIETWTVEPVFIEPEDMPGARMHITLIVKRDNRRKHNTLEWFFSSFALEYGAEYSFTTDCGTLFEPDTIYHLAQHLDLFPRCGGVTGRQRVMSAKQQGLDRESWYAAWMRSVQGFEYEATYASYVGAFSMTGMLPVIPGPCGLFNMKHLIGQGVQFFFDKVKQDPDTAGLLLGNGLLAEDRFLSYAAVVSTGNPTITEFVPESVFYFEAETELRTFVFQRRRWNNGTFACFVWLMLNLDIIRKSPHGIVFKLLMQFLVVWQVLWLAVSLVAPSLFLVLLRLGIRHTFPANETSGTSFWADVLCIIYMLLYVSFIAKHVESKFEAWLFHVFTFIHGLAVVFIISTFVHAAATRRDHVIDLTLYLFAVYQGAPILLSLIVSPRSCGFLVKYFLPYIIFLPTQTMTFWTYALTRTFDLTWGNRPTTHKVPKTERNLIVDKLKSSAVSLISLVAAVNLVIALILLQIAVSGQTLWIIWTLVSLMVFSGVQMTLSFGFAIEYHFIRRTKRWFRLGRLARARYNRKNRRKVIEDKKSQAQLLEWDNSGVPGA